MPFLLSDEEWGITPEMRVNGARTDEELKVLRKAWIDFINNYLEAFWKYHREKNG